ncbi:FtsX-like permease family protein [Streptomyces huasconensis]|uniref:FtsX-like permease family protein n=1 Tax=Streptomyces huasconensis TaxID=1854574 RepID=A0ABV3LQV5_9ACTN
MTGFVLLRVRAHRLLLAAALLAVLLTTAILTTLAAFSGAIGDAALRHTLRTRSAAPAALVVRTQVPAGEQEAARRVVREGARRTFDGLPVRLRSLARSGTYALPGAARGDRPDLTRLAALDRSGIRLTEGSWPGGASAGDAKGPIEVAVPETAAAKLRLGPGARPLTLTDRLTGHDVTVRVTGVYRPADTGDPYWQLDELGGRGLRKGDFMTYGPLLVDPAALTRSRVSADGTQWLATADFGTVTTERVGALREAARKGPAALAKKSALGGNPSAATALPDVLDRAERALLVSRSTLLIVALQLIMLAGYALLLVARLLFAERGGETELLLARGAARGRVVWFAAVEALLLALPAAVLAPLLAGPLTGLLAGQGALARTGLRLDGAAGTTVWAAAAITASGCALAVVAPALSATSGRRSAPRRSVRASALPAPLRAGADVGLLVIAAVAYWQVNSRTSGAGALTDDRSGRLGVDPLLVAAPALALLAGTVVTLRLLPPAARVAERYAAKGRGLSGALAGWQLSRRPLRGAGPVLLLVLAVAMGMLAIGQGASWDRSQEDQADFRAGAPVRVLGSRVPDGEQARVFATLPGVRGAAPAVRFPMDLSDDRQATVLALDLARAAPGMLTREDSGSGEEIAGALVPEGREPEGRASGGSSPVRAVVTDAFLRASGARVGARLDVPAGSGELPVRIVKAVRQVPTAGTGGSGPDGDAAATDGGAVLLDLPAVNARLTRAGEKPLAPTEWWLTPRPGAADRTAAALRARPDIDPEQVLVREEIADELRDDPLGAGPQSALLAVAAAAAALAAVGFAVSAAASLRERSAEFAVLRALGAPRRRLARLIAAEQGFLLGLALLVGLGLGAVLTRAVVPLIVLTGDAAQPVPPVLVELPLSHVAALLTGVAAVPLLIVAALALRRGDPTVSLRHEGGN